MALGLENSWQFYQETRYLGQNLPLADAKYQLSGDSTNPLASLVPDGK